MKSKSLLLILCIFSGHLLFSQNEEKKIVEVGKIKIAYKAFGIEHRKANDPVLVFESGMGGGSFEQIFSYLPSGITGIEYDRNGLGRSEIDTSIKSDLLVVDQLHRLLSVLGIKPPYLMVGHSLGGPLIRLFEAVYPGEVSGLVFIDPTDFMLTKEEDERIKKETSSLNGYQYIWSINLKTMANDTSMPSGIKAEFRRELTASTPVFFKEYKSLPPLENIPVSVIISYNKPADFNENEMNLKLKLGINLIPWWRELDNVRIAHYSDLIRNNNNSKLILLPGYSHGIQYQDPKLVAEVVSENYEKCLSARK